MQKLFVRTEPNLSDPAGLIPVIDFTDPNKMIQYSDETLLVELAQKIRDKRMESIGHAKGVEWVLKLFGITQEDFHKKLRERA